VAGDVALLEHLDAALTSPSLINLNRPRIEALRADLGDGSVPALFAHPPARLQWRLRLETDVELETALGLQPGAWEHSGDGVVFVVGVRDWLGAHELRRVTLDPRRTAADRAWRPLSVDLSPWRGRTIRLTLRTEAGERGDAGWDWAVWRAPTLRRSGGGG